MKITITCSQGTWKFAGKFCALEAESRLGVLGKESVDVELLAYSDVDGSTVVFRFSEPANLIEEKMEDFILFDNQLLDEEIRLKYASNIYDYMEGLHQEMASSSRAEIQEKYKPKYVTLRDVTVYWKGGKRVFYTISEATYFIESDAVKTGWFSKLSVVMRYGLIGKSEALDKNLIMETKKKPEVVAKLEAWRSEWFD